MEMQVEHRLAGGRFVELHHRHAISLESGLRRNRDLLDHADQAAKNGRGGIEKIARRGFRNDQDTSTPSRSSRKS